MLALPDTWERRGQKEMWWSSWYPKPWHSISSPCSRLLYSVLRTCTVKWWSWPSIILTSWLPPGAWSQSGVGPACWRCTCAAWRTCWRWQTGLGTISSIWVPPTTPPGQSLGKGKAQQAAKGYADDLWTLRSHETSWNDLNGKHQGSPSSHPPSLMQKCR